MNIPALQSNQHIHSFLRYYFALPVAPHYAVMIKGPWGSGKTHLIKSIVETAAMKVLYVSLNGVSSTKEIEAEFFRQLHPVLSNPKVKLLGKLVQGALKVNLNFDSHGDAKNDGSFQAGVPDLDLSKYADSPERLLLVFDDLERCHLPVSQILGYINYFVEHSDCKVLVLADEDWIIRSDTVQKDTVNDYAKVREKVIGKTLEVELDTRAAIANFTGAVTNQHAKKAISENLEFIEEIFVASSYKNLRHLRQALLDYSRIVDDIQVQTYKKDMLRSLLGTLIMYSLETRSGTLDPQDIGNLHKIALFHAVKKEEGPSLTQVFETRYFKLGIMDSFIPEPHWRYFFTNGAFPSGSVNEHVHRSEYYAQPAERPLWLRLQEMYRSDDEPLKAALQDADAIHRAAKISSIAELLNITGSLLALSTHGIYEVPRSVIVENAKKCIAELRNQSAFNSQRRFKDYDHDATFGYMHHSRDTDEYKEVIEYLIKSRSDAEIEAYPVEASELLALLGADTDEFIRLLNLEADQEPGYLSRPVLKYADLTVFVEQLRSLKASAMMKLSKGFKERYKFSPSELAEEELWLEECIKKIEVVKSERIGTMAAFWLEELVKVMRDAVHGYNARTRCSTS
jgi:hypothetical protein